MTTIFLDDFDERIIKILATKMTVDENTIADKPKSAYWSDIDFMKKVEKPKDKK